jgi:predicted SprT family Zn-dependent metalloprotease
MIKQLKTIFREIDGPEQREPQLYINSKGNTLHMLHCECGSCTIRPRQYRRAFKELNNG